MNILKKAFQLFSGFGSAVIILLLLLLLVFLGTLYQVDNGIYEAQQKYFDSLYVVHMLFGVVPLPLPGVYLLSSLFFVNLVLGGIIRMRKNWKTPGIFIAHIGIIVLLVGGFVTFHYSDSGNMQLYEGQTSNEFLSYHEWQIEVGQPNFSDTVAVIEDDNFNDLQPGEQRVFHNAEWPFEITLSGYAENTWPVRTGPNTSPAVKAIDGVYLETLEGEKEAEQNIAGVYATVRELSSGNVTEGILWGMARQPFTVNVGDEQWTIDMVRKRWSVPFVVTLDDFIRELHPGTQMAASYESYITKTEGASTEKIRIYMNHPLRYKGYTFFQASWGPQNAGPNEPLFSVFSVVRNPADQVPLISCIIVGIGLSIHFLQRLTRYLRSEAKKRATA